MDFENKLRSDLIKQIQVLSADKLTEITNLLSKMENRLKSKEKTLELAGTWNDMDNDVFEGFTKNLHDSRKIDQRINFL